MLRILLVVLYFFCAPVFATANCPDADGDGYTESCVDEDGVLVLSEDNCPFISNPDQQQYRLIAGSWVEDNGSCYDYNGDGVLTSADLSAMFAKNNQNVNGTFFYEMPDMIGDLNHAPYSYGGNQVLVDWGDYALEQCGLIKLGVMPYNSNPACLTQ